MIQQAYVEGVSTRRVDDLVKALGCEGISKSQVSRICGELDRVVDSLYVVFDLQIVNLWVFSGLWVGCTQVVASLDQQVSQATALDCTVGSMTPLSPHLTLRTDTRARGPHLKCGA